MWIGIALHGSGSWPAAPLRGGRELPQGLPVRALGLFFVLGTVHIWGAVSVFVMFYLGAGAWFYASDSAGARAGTVPPARRRDRQTASWW